MRILFMGTPAFAVPSLAALVEAGHEVCGVFSQPDKPVGRHQNKLQPTPVKEFAVTHHIPVFQPVKLRDGSALAQIRALGPELIVVGGGGRPPPPPRQGETPPGGSEMCIRDSSGPHAEPGALTHGLEAHRTGAAQPGAGADPLARRRDGAGRLPL